MKTYAIIDSDDALLLQLNEKIENNIIFTN